jgi:hypothetical protein
VFAPEELGGCSGRPDAEPVNGDDLLTIRKTDHDWSNARDIHDVAVQHPERDAGRDTGIDRVSARFKNQEARVSRCIVASGYHVTVARQHAAVS